MDPISEIEIKMEPMDKEFDDEESSSLAKQSRCLICYYSIYYSNYWMNSTGEENLQSLNSHRSLKLVQIYKTLNIKLSSKVKNLNEEFEPPLCALCSETVQKCINLEEELQQLEKELSSLKKETKQKLIDSFEQAPEFSEQTTETLNDIMKTVDLIRRDSMTVLGISSPKNAKSIKKQKVKTPEIDNRNPGAKIELKNPCILLERLADTSSKESKETNQKRSSRGRLIKQPKTYIDSHQISSESEAEETTKPLLKMDVQKNDNDKADNCVSDENAEVNMDDMEEPEWSPCGSMDKEDDDDKSASENSSFTEDSNCSDSDYSGEESDKIKGEILDDKNKIKKEPVEAKKKRIRNKSTRKKSGIPIKVIEMEDGEEFEGIFIKDKSDTQTTFENNLESIEPGTVVTMKRSKMNGVMVKCTDPECTKTFSMIERMKIHVKKIHEGIKRAFNCSSCDKKFSRSNDLKRHVIQNHGSPTKKAEWNRKIKYHTCEYADCNQQYRHRQDLQIHIRKVHTHETPFKCDHCTESCVSALKLEFHVETSHQDIPPLRCEHCPRGFFRHHRLREHVKSHTGERAYLCEICSKSFSQPSYLRYHQTQHKELELEPIKCILCDKSFASPTNLKLHHETQHEKQYRFRCKICNHGTTTNSSLTIHMRCHTGEKPHVCTICNKSYVRGSQLKIHQRVHSGIRPYVCKIDNCGATFTANSKLRRHELIHSKANNNYKRRNPKKTKNEPELEPSEEDETEEEEEYTYGSILP